MTFVVDASVAVKWFIEESHSAEAKAVLASRHVLIAPDLVVAEVCNAAWKKIREREISREHGTQIADSVGRSFDRLVGSQELASRAFELAVTGDHAVYDCLYLALAEAESAVLVTDDARLLALAKRNGLGDLVSPLAGFGGKKRGEK